MAHGFTQCYLSPGRGDIPALVTSAGWQVTLCDSMWHVSSRSGVATLRTAIHLLLVTYTQTGSQITLHRQQEATSLHSVHAMRPNNTARYESVQNHTLQTKTRNRCQIVALHLAYSRYIMSSLSQFSHLAATNRIGSNRT